VYCLLAVGCWILAIGYWLLSIGYWLLSIVYWLLAIVAAVHLNSLNVVVKIAKMPSFPIETKTHLPLGVPLVPGYPLALAWQGTETALSGLTG
jgi:hypothetical protein